MARMSSVTNSFLDGFGALGAIFEPVVRPGSRDNLIQERLAPLADRTLRVDGGLAHELLIRELLEGQKRRMSYLLWTIPFMEACVVFSIVLVVRSLPTQSHAMSPMDWFLVTAVPAILVAISHFVLDYLRKKDFTKIAELLAKTRGESLRVGEKAHHGA